MLVQVQLAWMTDAYASRNLLSVSVGVVIILTSVQRASALPLSAPVSHF